MNLQEITDKLTEAKSIIDDPEKSEQERFEALKQRAITEADVALMVTYHKRAVALIRSKVPKGFWGFSNHSRDIDDPLSYSRQRRYDPDEEYRIHISNVAYGVAEEAFSKDSKPKDFKELVEGLEEREKSLLEAAHCVSYNIPRKTQNFLEILAQVHRDYWADYAALVSYMFRNDREYIIGDELLSRFRIITPVEPPRQPVDPRLELFNKVAASLVDRDYRYLSTEEQYVERNKDKVIASVLKENKELDEILREIERSKLQIGAELRKNLGMSPEPEGCPITPIEDPFKERAEIFFYELGKLSAVSESKAGKPGVVGAWIRSANRLIKEDEESGLEFAFESGETAAAYQYNLELSMDQFAEDYKALGKDIFRVKDFFKTDLPVERKQSIIRELVNNRDLKLFDRIADIRKTIPENDVRRIYDALAADISNSDLIKALEETIKIYKRCKDNNIGAAILYNVPAESNIFEKPNLSFKSLDEYLEALRPVERFIDEYIEFAAEQKKKLNDFSDSSTQGALKFYRDYLGKNLSQFKRDFRATDGKINNLPLIFQIYSPYFAPRKLKSIINYVAKQRSKDLLQLLAPVHHRLVPNEFNEAFIGKMDKNMSKENIVKSLAEFNRTYAFFRDLGETQRLECRIDKLPESCSLDQAMSMLRGLKRELYKEVISDLEVPEELEEMIDNVVTAYYKDSGKIIKVNVKPSLRFIAAAYLREGPKKTFNAIRRLKPNKRLRKRLRREGVDIDAYETGIRREYHVKTDETVVDRILNRIRSELTQISDRMSELGITYKPEENEDEEIEQLFQEKKLQDLKDPVNQKLKKLEKLVNEHKFTEENKHLKKDIKGHIQTARSISGRVYEMERDVRFYVSQDPLEALHMGEYFGTCISLVKGHNGINGWSSVTNVMNSNRNVIYARGVDGNYYGRNRTALTDQGILCTKFHRIGEMNMDQAWIDYLTGFADETGQDVMIPADFASDHMPKILEKMEERVVQEKRTLFIEPAYYSAFYGDGLYVLKEKDGRARVEVDVYVIKHAEEVKK
jgi:hypothetical protein